MKKVYIYLALTVLIAAGLFALSFFYIDRHGRETFLYAIYRDNLLIGYDKVDRYEV